MKAIRELPTRLKCGLLFATAGFLVAEILCADAFYLTSHDRIGNELLFIILCPPSIGAIALDNAGVVGGLIGWLFIALENAALYGVIGSALCLLVGTTKRLLK